MGKSVRKDVLSFSAHLAPTISLVLTRQEKFDHVLELAWRLRDRASRMLGAHEKGRGGVVIHCAQILKRNTNRGDDRRADILTAVAVAIAICSMNSLNTRWFFSVPTSKDSL